MEFSIFKKATPLSSAGSKNQRICFLLLFFEIDLILDVLILPFLFLLVTNNGDLANKLMHPKNLIPKIYEAETDLLLNAKLISKIKKGVFIGYNQWAKAIVVNQKKIKSRILVTLQLHHGKNREIRRLFNKINRRLFSLKRVRYGDLELGNLPLGKFRELNKIELNKVQKSIYG